MTRSPAETPENRRRRASRTRNAAPSRKPSAKRRLERRAWLEALEDRRLLTSAWQNAPYALDVTDDGFTSPVDALVIINELNARTIADAQGRLPSTKPPHQPFFDTDGDTFVAPRDALIAINLFNAGEPTLRVTAGLARDTAAPLLATNQDGLTFDPSLIGVITFAGATPTVYGRVDGGSPVVVVPGVDGSYTFVPPLATNGAADGSHELRVTAVSSLGQVATAFVSISLDTRPPSPAPVLALHAAFDTAPVGDLVTQFDRVTLVGTAPAGASVTLLETGASALADESGAFQFADLPLTLGDNSFQARVYDTAGNAATGSVTITRVEVQVDEDPPVLEAALSVDTGRSASDGVTSDFSIQGRAVDASGVAVLRVGFDERSSFDILGSLQPDGSFTLAMDALEAANGATLSDGPHRLIFDGVDTLGQATQFTVLFELDRTPPAPPTLELAESSDTAPVGDGVTTIGMIALTGLSEPGVPVEFVETGRSVVPDLTGAFEFSAVALAYGASPFTVRATDVAGNVGQTQRRFTRQFAGVVVAEAERRIERVTLPIDLGTHDGARSISFDLLATFDGQSAGAAFPDEFSVYLTDSAGRTLIDRGVPGTTLFSLNERETPASPSASGVTFNGSRVTIDVTGLAGRGAANFVFEFRNFDDDFGGSVEIAALSFDVDPLATVTRSIAPRLGIAVPVAIDSDYVRYGETYPSENVAVSADNLRFDPATGITTLDLRIANHTGVTLGRDVYVALGDLPVGAQVVDVSRPDGLGRPLLNLASVVPETGLPEGATSERLTVRVRLDDPLAQRFSPTFAVTARPAVLEIFERVVNAYEFDPYRGALRGPDGVRDVGAGNAWDISSVLIEDLRAAGIHAEYAFDTVTMPVDDVVNWLGARNAAGAFAMLDAAHLDVVAIHQDGDPELPVIAFSFDHAWVWANLALPGSPPRLIDLDPSFKRHVFQQGVEDLATLVPFDYETYLSQSWPVYTDGFYANQVADYLDANLPGTTLEDVPYRATMVPQHFTRLVPLTMLSFTYDGNPFVQPEIPTYDQNRVILEFRYPGGGVFNLPPSTLISREINLARDARETIVASLESQRSYIAVGNDYVYSGGATGGTPIEVVASYIYADDDDVIGVPDAVRIFNGSFGGGEVIGVAFGVGQIGPGLLAQRWKEANNFERSNSPLAPSQVLRSLTALEYFHGEYEALDRIAGLTEQRRNYSKIGLGMAIGGPNPSSPNYVVPYPDLPVTEILSNRFGLYSDFLPFAVPLDGDDLGAVTRDRLTIFNNSDQERALWERVFNSSGFNTVRSIQLAHEAGIPIFTIDATNRETLLPQLQLSGQTVAFIEQFLNAGLEIVTPRDYTPLNDYSGVGFFAMAPGDPVPAGFLISSGVKGGIRTYTYPLPPYPCPNNVPAGGLPLGKPKAQFMCPSTGSLIRDEQDIAIPAVGLDLDFGRRYDSSFEFDLGMGRGWLPTYSEAVYRHVDEGPVYWVTDEGRTWEFLTDGHGGYITPVELDGTMRRSGDLFTYREKDGFEHRFNSGGQLLRLVDRYGNALDMTYDGSRRLTRVDHATSPGRSLTFQYDSTGHLTRVSDFTGRTWNFGYQSFGSVASGQSYTLLTSVTTPSDGVTEEQETRYDYLLTNYSSDPMAGLLRRVVDPDGLATTYRYYPNRMLFQYEEPDGGVGSYYYNVLGGETRFINERGYESRYQYDGRGYVNSISEERGDGGYSTTQYVWLNDEIVRETNPLGYVSTYEYDGLHNLVHYVDAAGGATSYTYDTTYSQRTSVTDPLGRTTMFALDGKGNVIRETDPLGNFVTYTYDLYGQRLTTTNPLGNLTSAEGDYTTHFTYDATGLVISLGTDFPSFDTYYLDERGNVLQHDDANDHSTIYTYDLLDRRLTKTDASGGVDRFYYDTLDRLVATVDPLGRTTSYQYDRVNSTITTVYPDGSRTIERYDPLDNLIAFVDPRSNVTRYEYDGLNRRTKTTFADRSTERFAYDADGRMIGRTDARGAKTKLVYDPLDRLTAVIDPLGHAETMGYDAVGNLTSATDRRGGVTQYAYDADDRLIETIDPLLNSTTVAFDANSNVVSTTDAAGFTTTLQYGVLDRLVRAIDPLNGVTQFAYDRAGNRIAVTDPNGHVNQFGYDALDRLVATTDPLGHVSTLSYDRAGNLIATRDPLGREARFTFDQRDRVIRTVDPAGAETTRAYDLSGNLIAQTDQLGFLTQFEYDLLDRRIVQIDPLGSRFQQDYDANGNPIRRTDELGRVTTSTYDALDRLTSSTDALGGVTSYAYDADDHLVRKTDALGRFSQWAYDALGRTIQYVDPLAGVRATTYDAVGNVSSQVDPLGRTALFTYDAVRRPVTSTDAAGSVTQWRYDSAGNLLSTIDPRGRTTTNVYDARDQRIQVVDPLDGVWEYEYDAVGNRVRVVNPRGFATSSTYDELDRLRSTTDALGAVRRWNYDAAGQLIALVDPIDRETSYAYDALGRPVAVYDPTGGSRAYEYDAVGNLTAEIDELGRVTRHFYDALDRMTRSRDALDQDVRFTYDAVGNPKSVTDRLGRVTRYDYDALDRLTRTTDALEGTVEYAYDAADNLKRVVDELGRETRYQYDVLNRVVRATDPLGLETDFDYDRVGNLVATTDALGRTTATEYDRLDRPTRQIDALGGVRSTQYDANGNVVARVDELGRTTRFEFDALDRPLKTIDPLGGETHFEFDLVGDLRSVTDALGHVTRHFYDPLHREVATVDPLGATTGFAYDLVGNLIGITDPDLNATSFEYDALDRLIRETDALGAARQFAHDAEGNVVETTDRNGRRIRNTYDDLNRRIQEEWLDGAGLPIRSSQTSYDAAGQLLGAADPDSAYAFAYDLGGRVTGVSNAGTPGAPTVEFSYQYDAAHRRVGRDETVGGVVGPSNRYAFDALDRLTQVTQSGPGAAPKRVDFSYDAAGQVKGASRYADLAATILVAATNKNYDLAGRVTGILHSHGATELADYSFAYDAAHRLVRMTGPDGPTDYVYDALGQLSDVDHANQDDESFTYDEAGNRTSPGYVTGADNRLLSDGRFNYAYDAEGNRVARAEIATGAVTEYTFDYRNRLTSVVNRAAAGGPITFRADYVYDVFDRRIAKSVDGDGDGPAVAETTRFVLDDAQIALQLNGAGQVTHRYLYADGIDQILADENALGEVLWPLVDHQGTVRDLVDSTGAVVNHIVYDSFGGRVAETDADVDFLFGYTGRELDEETGLMYYRARYYDPAVGRFVSQDPLGFAGGDGNFYRYVGNGPTNATDPWGLYQVDADGSLVPDVTFGALPETAPAPSSVLLQGGIETRERVGGIEHNVAIKGDAPAKRKKTKLCKKCAAKRKPRAKPKQVNSGAGPIRHVSPQGNPSSGGGGSTQAPRGVDLSALLADEAPAQFKVDMKIRTVHDGKISSNDEDLRHQMLKEVALSDTPAARQMKRLEGQLNKFRTTDDNLDDAPFIPTTKKRAEDFYKKSGLEAVVNFTQMAGDLKGLVNVTRHLPRLLSEIPQLDLTVSKLAKTLHGHVETGPSYGLGIDVNPTAMVTGANAFEERQLREFLKDGNPGYAYYDELLAGFKQARENFLAKGDLTSAEFVEKSIFNAQELQRQFKFNCISTTESQIRRIHGSSPHGGYQPTGSVTGLEAPTVNPLTNTEAYGQKRGSFFQFRSMVDRIGGTRHEPKSYDEVFGERGLAHFLPAGRALALNYPLPNGAGGHAVVLYKSQSGNLFIIDGQSNKAYNAYEAQGAQFLQSLRWFEAITFP